MLKKVITVIVAILFFANSTSYGLGTMPLSARPDDPAREEVRRQASRLWSGNIGPAVASLLEMLDEAEVVPEGRSFYVREGDFEKSDAAGEFTAARIEPVEGNKREITVHSDFIKFCQNIPAGQISQKLKELKSRTTVLRRGQITDVVLPSVDVHASGVSVPDNIGNVRLPESTPTVEELEDLKKNLTEERHRAAEEGKKDAVIRFDEKLEHLILQINELKKPAPATETVATEKTEPNLAVEQRIKEIVENAVRDMRKDNIKALISEVAKNNPVSVDSNVITIRKMGEVVESRIDIPDGASPFIRSARIVQMDLIRHFVRILASKQSIHDINPDFLYKAIDSTRTDLGTGAKERFWALIKSYLPRLNRHVTEEVASSIDRIEGIENAERIVLCGMGGSGIAGNILSAMAAEYRRFSDIEVITVKGFELPDSLTENEKDTSYILSSFSGTTGETLKMGQRLAEKGKKKVIAISSGQGDKLGRMADKNGWGFISIVKAGMLVQPREAYPVTVLKLNAFLERIFSLRENVRVVSGVENIFGKLAENQSIIGQAAESLAKEAYGKNGKSKIPVFITDEKSLSQAIATRCMQQLAECAFVPSIIYTEREILDHSISLDQDIFAVFTIGDVQLIPGSQSLTQVIEDLFATPELSILQKIYGIETLITSMAYDLAVLRGIEPMVVPLITGDERGGDIPAYKDVLKTGTPAHARMLADYEKHQAGYKRITDVVSETAIHPVVNVITTEQARARAEKIRNALLEADRIAYITVLPEGNHNENNTWLPLFAMGTNAEKIGYVLVTGEDELREDWLKATMEYFLHPTNRAYLYTGSDELTVSPESRLSGALEGAEKRENDRGRFGPKPRRAPKKIQGLKLTRKLGKSIIIRNNISLTYHKQDGKQAKILVQCPENITVAPYEKRSKLDSEREVKEPARTTAHVISRGHEEAIVIKAGEDIITVTVLKRKRERGKIDFVIDAPRDIRILRAELLEKSGRPTQPGKSPEAAKLVIALSAGLKADLETKGYFTLEEFLAGHREMASGYPELGWTTISESQARRDLEALTVDDGTEDVTTAILEINKNIKPYEYSLTFNGTNIIEDLKLNLLQEKNAAKVQVAAERQVITEPDRPSTGPKIDTAPAEGDVDSFGKRAAEPVEAEETQPLSREESAAIIEAVYDFADRTTKDEEPLSIDEANKLVDGNTQTALWDLVNLFHNDKMEVIASERGVGSLTGKIQGALREIKRNFRRKSGPTGAEVIDWNLFGNTKRLEELLSTNPDRKKVLIVEKTSKADVTALLESRPDLFEKVRLLPVKLSNRYRRMGEKEKTAHQMNLLTKAVFVRLYEKTASPLVQTVMQATFRDNVKDVEEFLNSLTEPENETDAQRKKRLSDLLNDVVVRLTGILEHEMRLLKVFWIYA